MGLLAAGLSFDVVATLAMFNSLSTITSLMVVGESPTELATWWVSSLVKVTDELMTATCILTQPI